MDSNLHRENCVRQAKSTGKNEDKGKVMRKLRENKMKNK